MKKSNIITFVLLLVVTAGVLIYAVSSGHDNPATVPTDEPTENPTQEVKPTDTLKPTKPVETKPAETKAPKPSKDLTPVSLNDTLFVGDSRTVGIREYSGLKGADFFCSVGMNVFDVTGESLSVDGVGNVTLSQLLSKKQYSKVYIMLGINEVGYPHSSVVDKYSKVLDLIKEKQPNASIIIEANLHVSKSRSDSDKVVNNASINDLNTKLSALADGSKVFYIDANTIFDDASGSLSSDMTSDGTHLYAKYYPTWVEWISTETAKYI